MDVTLLREDLEAKPAALLGLAEALRLTDPYAGLPRPARVLFLGMGSSRYAAGVAARRLRAAGVDAVAEYASAAASYPPRPDTLVVAISATGGSAETLAATEPYPRPLVLTNDPDSPLAQRAGRIVPLLAGPERSGVACRTFQHALALLLLLEERLTGRRVDVPALCERAAEATADLLDRRADWLPGTLSTLDGPDGVYALAPAERLSSAQQAALMIRESPRRPATGCETGDWSHVDVYLTKTRDYRALLFPGSRWDSPALEWLRQRGSRVVAVGAEVPGGEQTIRYRHDGDAEVRLLTEVLVAELVAAAWV
jgi:fructoselysine-6-P-deglycase FrlB-like protein